MIRIAVLSLILAFLPACVTNRKAPALNEWSNVPIGGVMLAAEEWQGLRTVRYRTIFQGVRNGNAILRTSGAINNAAAVPGNIEELEVPLGDGRSVAGMLMDLRQRPDGSLDFRVRKAEQP